MERKNLSFGARREPPKKLKLYPRNTMLDRNRLVSNYTLMVTDKRTDTRLRRIKQKKVEITFLSLVSVLLV